MKISVLVPTHNHGPFIARCLRSLFSQVNPPAFEIIVVDDASSDGTDKILDAFSSEIHLIRNEKNLGLPASLNRAIKAARGDYLVRVDSDDFVSRNFLNVLSMALELNPEIDSVCCDYVVFSDSNNSEPGEVRSAEENPIGCGIMFRKIQVLEVGLYNEEFLLHEDKEFRDRFSRRFNIARIPIPLYRYRRHSSNITNDVERLREFENKLASLRLPVDGS